MGIVHSNLFGYKSQLVNCKEKTEQYKGTRKSNLFVRPDKEVQPVQRVKYSFTATTCLGKDITVFLLELHFP